MRYLTKDECIIRLLYLVRIFFYGAITVHITPCIAIFTSSRKRSDCLEFLTYLIFHSSNHAVRDQTYGIPLNITNSPYETDPPKELRYNDDSALHGRSLVSFKYLWSSLVRHFFRWSQSLTFSNSCLLISSFTI